MRHLVFDMPVLFSILTALTLNSYRRHRALIRIQRGLRVYMGSVR